MIIKDAILKSLEEIEIPSNSTDVGNHIIKGTSKNSVFVIPN